MFRKIKDLRIEKFFDMEIDMNLCDVKLKERLVEIFNKVNIDIVSFYENNAKYYNNPMFEGTELKKQKDRLERLIEEIATEKKKFASSENIEFKIDVIIDESFMEKLKEEITIIRKLEDFDGFPNGKGLFMVFDTKEKTLSIAYNLKILYKVDTRIKSSLVHILEIAKSMGFKFEYKPLRTKEEVLADIKRLACERSQDCRGVILQDVNTKKYHYTDDYEVLGNGKFYFQEEIAHELIIEINDILENE